MSILLTMSQLMGIQDTPQHASQDWQGLGRWERHDGSLIFQAESKTLAARCRAHPKAYIRFPVVLYAAHEILLDDVKRIQFGDADMQTANHVVSAPVLECHAIANIDSIRWRVTAYSRYFARVSSFPQLVEHKPLTHLFGETLYIGSSMGLIILSIFAMSLLYGKESNRLMVSLFFSIIFMAVYQFSLIAPAFEVDLPMITIHRIGDIGLVLGVLFVTASFWIENLIPKFLFQLVAVNTALSLPFFLLGTTGDTLQFGTSIPMLSVFATFATAAFRLRHEFRRSTTVETTLKFLFSAIFVYVVGNDILVFTGSITGYTYMSVGILLAFLILLLAVNQRILATYRERDYLRGNLEEEVKRKTSELTAKTELLQTTMMDLQSTQAELIHSAKLASLGTLAAGIAHEINNSINFVSGAISPLERIVGKLKGVSQRDHDVGLKLLHAVRDGTSLTIEIVKSLRQFTGLNQAKLKDIDLSEVIQSVTTILTPRLKENYQIIKDIPNDLPLYGDVVGINQILMNLITNALDAMPHGGQIFIRAREENNWTIVEIQDSGTGIPPELTARIFDPFFTTKEVGSGTGLGLHIIRQEMNRHKGEVTVDSQLGQGTKFTLRFPKTTTKREVAA